jgi:hypothetical protein
MKMLKKATLALALASTAAVTAAPAQARDYHRSRDNSGAAILAGVLGIAAIAVIASSANQDRYRDRYYYRDGRRYDRYYNHPDRYNDRWNHRNRYDHERYERYDGDRRYDGYYGQRYGY